MGKLHGISGANLALVEKGGQLRYIDHAEAVVWQEK